MPKLRAKEIRRLAWNDLGAGQYWPFVGGNLVLTLIFGAFTIIGVVAIVVPGVVMAARAGDMKRVEEMFRPENLLPILLFSCVAAVPVLYGLGFMTWGQIRLALAAANRELKFAIFLRSLFQYRHGAFLP